MPLRPIAYGREGARFAVLFDALAISSPPATHAQKRIGRDTDRAPAWKDAKGREWWG